MCLQNVFLSFGFNTFFAVQLWGSHMHSFSVQWVIAFHQFWYLILISSSQSMLMCYVQNLWTMLDKHQSPPLMPEEQMINYEDFLKVGAASSAKCK